jgi:hypothetical protein
MAEINDPMHANDPFTQEPVGGGGESVPDPREDDPHEHDPRELGGDDTVAANDELSDEEVER